MPPTTSPGVPGSGGMTLAQLTSSAKGQITGKAPSGFAVTAVHSVVCNPPSTWAAAKTFTCYAYDSQGAEVGEYDGTVEPNSSSGNWQWNAEWVPNAGYSAPTTSVPSTTQAAASVGSTLSLNDGEGDTFTVTLLQFVDPATPASSFDTAPAGDNLAEVLLKITGVTGTYSDDANSDVSVIGSDDQTYSPGFESLNGCTNFSSGAFTVTPGQSSSGCVAIEIKTSVTADTVEFSAGYGNDVGEWKVG